MILVDTSAWVDFLRGKESPAHLNLASLIAAGQPVAGTEPVSMELLAGARTPHERDVINRLMSSLAWLSVRTESDFDAAATIYSACRQRGFTPRGLVACLIAAVALRTGIPLLAADRDFDHMAAVMPLRLA